jgi:hypothetical protein
MGLAPIGSARVVRWPRAVRSGLPGRRERLARGRQAPPRVAVQPGATTRCSSSRWSVRVSRQVPDVRVRALRPSTPPDAAADRVQQGCRAAAAAAAPNTSRTDGLRGLASSGRVEQGCARGWSSGRRRSGLVRSQHAAPIRWPRGHPDVRPGERCPFTGTRDWREGRPLEEKHEMNRTAIAAMIAAVAGSAVAQPVQWRVEDVAGRIASDVRELGADVRCRRL